MDSSKLRSLFLNFFDKKNHSIYPSSSMVLKDDSSLMFANAGMNQFKDRFLGNTKIKDPRVVNSQKCMRVSGKHNDLEQVGHDTYHHTMFEMLGNWSFGDYFKEEAIRWSWEFLTDVLKLDKERLYVTVYEGDIKDKIQKDNDSYNIWKKYVPIDRIINGNKNDNFWEMGEIGPCGPSSEIHYDNRPQSERDIVSGSRLVNKDHDQVIEIWNLVFIQYNRRIDKSLELLEMNHVDTGMGLERLCMIMQKKKSTYDTDLFTPIITKIEELTGKKYGKDKDIDVAIRVVADHIRSISFSIADGQLPSNVKAGYVVRRILRRAVRYYYTFLGYKKEMLFQLIDVLGDSFKDSYPEIYSQKDLISKVVKEEEISFIRTLNDGLKRLESIINNSNGVVSGKLVFELYDTYGFPKDLTSLILSENNLNYDDDSFTEEMNSQKNRSRNASKIDVSDWVNVSKGTIEEVVILCELESIVNLMKYREVKLNNQLRYQLVFDKTPFYAEAGGQIGDTGTINNSEEEVYILDTKNENNLIIHITDKLPSNLHVPFNAKVDSDRRNLISKNHSATHLLHESLNEILGDHVLQKGSFVSSEYLRFDFSHFSSLSDTEIQRIEDSVNRKINKSIPLKLHNDISLSKAKNMGAKMLFGEKYLEKVRVVQFATSMELCGGTHVNNTSEIHNFMIKSESSVASGIRRIEALTSLEVISYYNTYKKKIDDLSIKLKSADPIRSVEKLLLNNQKLTKDLENYKRKEELNTEKLLLENKYVFKGVNLIIDKVDLDLNSMKSIAFRFKSEQRDLVMLLYTEVDEKVYLTLLISEDLLGRNLHAGKIIKKLATEVKGSGGGQSFFATASGSKKGSFERVKNILQDIL